MTALSTAFRQMGDSLLDLVFPRRCIGCGDEGEFICTSCRQAFPKLEPPFCDRCGIPLTEGGPCRDCLKLPFAIDGIRSLFLHDGLARDAVHHLKYNRMKALARPLAQLAAEYMEHNPLSADLLVAVPMHSKRLRKRGYNQSDLLVRELSRLTHLPFADGAFVRLQNTPSQVSLGAEARRENVRGAFRCDGEIFRNARALLIDDVCTTGATLDACAIILKEAGAASVWALTLSREC